MEWDGHTVLAEAEKEFKEMRMLSFNSGIRPLDGYVYEASAPLYGNISTKLDGRSFGEHAVKWVEKQEI
jgi:hypothetical protein